ncbi:MAG: hypothetical protein ACRDKZ_08280 [Actinomycetota bacterium]
MSSATVTERPRPAGAGPGPRAAIDRLLGRPVAYLLTALILMTLFGWTFITNPDRVAPTKDPAYYTWRTEALMTEDPGTVLDIVGPFDFFSSGYRVVAPVTGALLRHIPAVGELHTTVFLMVLLPVLTALLLAGFAYRQRRDPMLWHAVAFLSASLYLTPPFVGYLDNILCLFLLAASLTFISATRESWPARIAFGLFLVGAGLTHPTTLVFFGFSLGLMSAIRLIWRRFDVRSVMRDDGPMLMSALAAAVLTFLIWTVGIWGPSMPLTDAALAPPYDGDFFVDRLVLWFEAMRPLFNGPLFVIGVVGILVSWKTWPEDDLGRVSIAWLAPLAGVFGFVGGLTYPYYRFFNTTLAWVLLVGLGAFFLARFLLSKSLVAGVAGLILVAVVVATNFMHGFDTTGWNNADGGWINASTRAELEALRLHLDGLEEDRPVVFAIDQEDHGQQVYGFTKLSGNTSRYGLPDGMVDQGFIYLGSVENFAQGEVTASDGGSAGEPACDGRTNKEELLDGEVYEALSAESLCDIEANSQGEPLVVVAKSFNSSGANEGLANSLETSGSPTLGGVSSAVWIVNGDTVTDLDDGEAPESVPGEGGSSPLHLVQVVAGLLLLLVLPGLLAFRFFLPDGTLADGLGMIPALSLMLTSFVGTALLAVIRVPFGTVMGWATLAVTVALCAGLKMRAGRASNRVR